MNGQMHIDIRNMSTALPIRQIREGDKSEVVRKFVLSLSAVGIDAQPEPNGVSYPGDGLPSVDNLLSDLIIGIVNKRFNGNHNVDLVGSGNIGSDSRVGPLLDQMEIQFIGGLDAANTLLRVHQLLLVLEVADPKNQVSGAAGLLEVTETGQRSDDSWLIELVTEIVRRRFSVERVRKHLNRRAGSGQP